MLWDDFVEETPTPSCSGPKNDQSASEVPWSYASQVDSVAEKFLRLFLESSQRDTPTCLFLLLAPILVGQIFNEIAESQPGVRHDDSDGVVKAFEAVQGARRNNLVVYGVVVEHPVGA